MILRYSNKKIKEIEKMALDDDIKKLLIGIYMIENTYRNIFYRIIEYMLLIISFIVNVFFEIPIRNYTVGTFQIGITSILIFYGDKTYDVHQKTINKLTKEQLNFIFKGIAYNNNLQICLCKINQYYEKLKSKGYNYYSLVGHIGELYNGDIGYGFKLQEIVNNIKLNEERALK